MSLFRILYTSRSDPLPGAPAMTFDDIRALAGKATKANQHRGVTGVLLHVDSTFIQVLEGPIGTLETLFERIVCDTRHSNVDLLISGPVSESLFPSWSMKFLAADDPDISQAFRVALAEIKRATDINAPEALTLMSALIRNGALQDSAVA